VARPSLLRRLRDEDHGMSLVEIGIACVLMVGALLLVFEGVDSASNAVGKQIDRSATTDELRIALTQLERQVRSGNLFYDPALETADPANGITPGFSLRVYTQANANRHPDFPNRCVQWRIHNGELQTREYAPNFHVNNNPYVTKFRTVATGLVNVQRGVTAFDLDESQTQYGRRLLRVVLLTNTDSKSGEDARVEVSVTGRNTGYGFPVTSCDAVPAYT
jgi:hypothetical protein